MVANGTLPVVALVLPGPRGGRGVGNWRAVTHREYVVRLSCTLGASIIWSRTLSYVYLHVGCFEAVVPLSRPLEHWSGSPNFLFFCLSCS